MTETSFQFIFGSEENKMKDKNRSYFESYICEDLYYYNLSLMEMIYFL